MTMQEYLNEMKHAASETLRLSWSEHKRLEDLEAYIARLTAQIEDSACRIQWLTDNPAFDDDLQSTAMHWESYFGPEKDRHYAEMSRPELEVLLDLRKFSIGALNAAALQYAKQGISLVHSQLSACPEGRMFGTQSLKNIIWQGRNQALHWEDQSFRPPVTACFETLAREINPKFNEVASRNLASDVVTLFGWKEYVNFERDMLLLA